MTETWMSHYTRDRLLHCGGRVPVGCRVANVLRVENHKARRSCRVPAMLIQCPRIFDDFWWFSCSFAYILRILSHGKSLSLIRPWGVMLFTVFPVWRLELEAYARYSSYKDALRMKRSQPCKRFTVRTSGKINLLDESVNEVAGREENVVEAGGLKSQGIIFFLFPFSVPCIMPFGRFDWGTCCDIVHPFAGKWMREGLNMSEYDWIWLLWLNHDMSWFAHVCTLGIFGILSLPFGCFSDWPHGGPWGLPLPRHKSRIGTVHLQRFLSNGSRWYLFWHHVWPRDLFGRKRAQTRFVCFFLCVSVSNILAFPDSQDMPFEFNLGQQERWVCKRRLWSLRWALCCATLPLQHGWSSYSFPSRGYARKVARRRLQLIVWWPVGRSWHLPGDGLFQRGGCVSWVHCNLHSFLWISFTALAPPRWSHCIPIARDLSWLFLP